MPFTLLSRSAARALTDPPRCHHDHTRHTILVEQHQTLVLTRGMEGGYPSGKMEGGSEGEMDGEERNDARVPFPSFRVPTARKSDWRSIGNPSLSPPLFVPIPSSSPLPVSSHSLISRLLLPHTCQLSIPTLAAKTRPCESLSLSFPCTHY
jgi:hypothetical protein